MAIHTNPRLLKKRRTKIVATLGPASSAPDTVAKLIGAGVNVFRLNMSHGDHAGHRRAFERIHAAARQAGAPIGVLADLTGPKIRTGQFPGGPITLLEGSEVVVTTRNVGGSAGLIPTQYEALAKDVKPGDRILLADGMLELRVENVEGTEVSCIVIQGGVLSDRQGINLPGVRVSAPSLTAKDREDVLFALDLGVDFLALSFVRRAVDVGELKAFIAKAGGEAEVIAKIERPEALEESEKIIELADAIMVARGDLGVELAPEQIPAVQQQLIEQARAENKPVIVATQMLESMTRHTRPTRAEVADISLTVTSGADALMLSAETAAGAHPVLAVEMMDRIIRQAEAHLWNQGAFGAFARSNPENRPLPFGDAVGNATAVLSRDLLVRGIVVTSQSGMSAATVSAARPSAPVIALSSSPRTCRRMNLLWGIIPMQVEATEITDPQRLARRLAQDLELAEPGGHILLVRGFHCEPEKNMPSISVLSV